jgi:hypothetical protein
MERDPPPALKPRRQTATEEPGGVWYTRTPSDLAQAHRTRT